MVNAFFCIHQTSGACTDISACNHTHQMHKTDLKNPSEETVFGNNKIKQHVTMKLQNEEVMLS